MAFKWRKWNRAVHRDFGYLFFGITLIYALSGIAINHIDDWNPNYIVYTENIQVAPYDGKPDKAAIKNMLAPFEEAASYKNHYFPQNNILKVFIKDGSVYINLKTGNGIIEKTKRRRVFREVNYLHYNPIKYWTWYSDIYAGALILLAVTGILIPRGEKGITKRGLWLVALSVVIPLIYLFIYFY
ncbi:MAG: hypothetical protein DRI88_05465 [Bacteroidetes bacterium]|nr:MAG: hypothetical protein DRI88_05465 [Bacteroidota bacterium]RLD71527.1 MAG: hypothetical protein DRI87_06795 [Bacteroidota bacterium]